MSDHFHFNAIATRLRCSSYPLARRMRNGILLPALAALLAACSTIECPVENKVYTLYHIYQNGVLTDLADTLYVTTRRKDGTTTLLNRLYGKSSFELPVSYQHPEDTLFFTIAPAGKAALTDTVWVKKNDIPHFESVDCSPFFFHELINVRSTHHAIDTIVINRTSVNFDAGTEHFHITFK